MEDKRRRTMVVCRFAILVSMFSFVLACKPAVKEKAVETPVVETPAVETPVDETPAVETPVVEEPMEKTPVVEASVEPPVVERTDIESPEVGSPVTTSDEAVDDGFASQPPDVEPKFDPLPALKEPWARITPEKSREKVWVNAATKEVAVEGYVCLTKGYLELFACTAGLKEHESIVALSARAQTLHFALLGVGAKAGKTARWSKFGDYTPATGQTIEVFVEWMKDGKPTKTQAQKWIRDLKTKKAMNHDWVFGGSQLRTDPETKKTYYSADSGGEIICVSNFPVAMMDLPIESSIVNEELAFEALTESIPKRKTPVRVYLIPRKEKEG